MCQELNRFTLDNEDSTTEVHNMDILGNLKKHNMDADHKDMENGANTAQAQAQAQHKPSLVCLRCHI